MNALRRAINAALRMGRDDPAVSKSAFDVLTDLAEIVEEIDRKVADAGPLDDVSAARLKQAVRELPDRDRAILSAYKAGMRRHEIAQKFGLDEIAVLRCLARTYAGLRMKSMAH